MKLWKAALVADLALVLGVGFGYAWWGREVGRLRDEVAAARARPAVTASEWTVRGVVRGVLPEMDVLVITHEEIAGFMPAMTMGFRAASKDVYAKVAIGDEIRFTLKGAPPNVAIAKIEKLR